MRKLLFLGLLLVAVVAFGQDETFQFNGAMTYGFTGNSDVINRSYADAYFILKAGFSEDTSATVKVSGAAPANKDTLDAKIENIFISQKLGPAIIEMGVIDYASTHHDPSDFGFANLSYGPGDLEAVGVRVPIGPLKVLAWFNPSQAGSGGNPMGTLTATAAVGPLNVAGFIGTGAKQEGIYGGSVAYTIPVGEMNLLGNVEYKHDVAVDDSMRWSTAHRLVHPVVEVGFDTLGDSEGIREAAGELTLNIVPAVGLSSINGVAYNVRDSEWDCAEIGGQVRWDRFKFRFGYFLTDNAGNGFSMYVPNPPQDGGLFLKLVAGW